MADVNITALYESDVALGAKADAAAINDLGDEVDKADKNNKRFSITGNKVADALLRSKTEAKGFGFALSAMKIPTYIAAFKAAVPAVLNLSAGLIALISNLSRMSGLIGALPGTVLALGTAFGVVKLAFSGIGNAVKEMSKPGAKLSDVQAALKGMPAPAQAFAKQLALMKPYLTQLRGTAASAFLPGVSEGLNQMTSLLPTVNRMLSVMGLVMGDLVREGARMFGSVGWATDLNSVGSTNAIVLQRMGKGLLAFLDGLRHVMVAAQPMTLALGAMVQRGGEWFQTATKAGRETGKLGAFFDRSVLTMRQWGRILRNLGGAIYQVFHGGAKLGNSLATSLEHITARWYAWTKSAMGTRRILRFFSDARKPLHELALLGSALFTTLFRVGDAGQSGVASTLKVLRLEGLPAIEKLVKSISNDFLPSLIKLAAVFGRALSFTNFEPLVTATGTVANLTLSIMKLIEGVPGLSQLATAALTVGIALKTWNAFKEVSGIAKLVTYLPAAKKGMDAFRLGTMGWTAAASGATGMEGALMTIGGLMVGPLGIVLAIAAVGAALVFAYNKVGWFHDGVNAAGRGIVSAFQAVVDFFGRIPGYIERTGISIVNYITSPYRTAFNAIGSMWNATVGRIPGLGGSLKVGKIEAIKGGWSMGDSTRPRAGGGRGSPAAGNMAKTMAVHRYVDSITPGRRTITSGVRGFALGSGDSDHPRGRALDLTGSFLNTYRANLASVGGYGAMHGSGPSSHLHMAVGDSTRPRAMAMAGGGGDTFQILGPLINFEKAPSSELDIELAVSRGIHRFVTDREERR